MLGASFESVWSVLRRFWAGQEGFFSMLGAPFESVLKCFEVLGRLGERFEHARSGFRECFGVF